MARNKYPEETVQKILEVSLKLFLEKGYDKTTMQDIVDNLGGLSKGAIYHHFKSKEDIFIAASEYLFSQDPSNRWAEIRDDPKLTAIEKARGLFLSSFRDKAESAFRDIAPTQAAMPRFLVSRIKHSVEDSAPGYLGPIFEQWAAEGGLQTAFPGELAQVMLLLVNIWMDASVFPVSDADFLRKLLFLMELGDKYGMEGIINEELMQSIQVNIVQSYNQKFKEQAEDGA